MTRAYVRIEESDSAPAELVEHHRDHYLTNSNATRIGLDEYKAARTDSGTIGLGEKLFGPHPQESERDIIDGPDDDHRFVVVNDCGK